MKYKVIDLFAGIGGMSKGFEEAGAKIVWANEIDKYACQIYKYNMPKVDLRVDDICKVDIDTVPDFHILIAGFSLPTFAKTGYKRRESNDKIQNLFFQILRFIEDRKPKAFLLETGKGLANFNKRQTFEEVLKHLKNNGYRIEYKVLNAMEYGNIPQNRQRLYIVGFRDDQHFDEFSFPKPIKLDKIVYDIIDVKDRKEDKCYYTDKYRHYHRLLAKIDNSKSIYRLIGQEIREYKDNVCPTLSGYNIPLIVDNFGIRKLTHEECLNLQGFKNYKIPTKTSNSRLYKLIRNSSTVNVVKEIAKSIIEVLDKDEQNKYSENNADTSMVTNSKIYCKSKNSDRNLSAKSGLENFSLQVKTLENINNERNISRKIMNEGMIENELINELQKIRPGKEDASKFHKYIYKVLCYIFDKNLARPLLEKEIDQGRKRIDILFDNLSHHGFFYELKNNYNIFCPKIIIECKNYSSTPCNPEIDQLFGRFSKYIGTFGILVCRRIDDKERLLARCKDVLNKDKGWIIPLSDDDIEELIKLRGEEAYEKINDYMRDKLNELTL